MGADYVFRLPFSNVSLESILCNVMKSVGGYLHMTFRNLLLQHIGKP